MASPATKTIPVNYPIHQPFDTKTYSGNNSIVRRTSRRQWPFVVADISWIASGVILTLMLRFHAIMALPRVSHSLIGHLCVSVSFAAIIVLLCHFQGLYSLELPVTQIQEVMIVAKSVMIGTILLGSLLFVSGVKSTSRLVVLMVAVYALVSMIGWRAFRRRSLGKAIADGVSCHNVIIVGTDGVALALSEYLEQHRELGFVVVGHVGSDFSASSDSVTSGKTKILGAPSDLRGICRKFFADEVMICTRDRSVAMQAIADARESGVGVLVVPDLYDGVAFGAHTRHLGGFPCLAVVLRSIPAFSMQMKRALDVVVAGCALLCLAPVLLILAALVRLTSTGPALYKSRRIGKKGRPFWCYKFRTMVADADKKKADLLHLNERNEVLFKIKHDPRITALGRVLRKYSLDELPQLWNVLRGDMSLVGPRPPLMSEVEKYQFEYLRRLEVAPGITGLWQVEARNHPSFDRYISLDLHYVENWSFLLDLQILFRTVVVVFAGTGS
jgi:exopolysaccharide biosynthesis polyprenyl glycosylphosphotransferase